MQGERAFSFCTNSEHSIKRSSKHKCAQPILNKKLKARCAILRQRITMQIVLMYPTLCAEYSHSVILSPCTRQKVSLSIVPRFTIIPVNLQCPE